MYFMVQGQTEMQIPQMVSSTLILFIAHSLAALAQAKASKKESRFKFTLQFFPEGALPGQNFTQVSQSPHSD